MKLVSMKYKNIPFTFTEANVPIVYKNIPFTFTEANVHIVGLYRFPVYIVYSTN